MTTRPLPNYLRTYRKYAGLSQEDVAFLLGHRYGTKISRHERFVREPTLLTVLAYELILGVSSQELFAGVYREVEQRTRQRARLLTRRLLKTDVTRQSNQKIVSLQGILARAGDTSNLIT